MVRRRTTRPNRHRTPKVPLSAFPDWFEELEEFSCLRSVVEDALAAKLLAENYQAQYKASCAGVYTAGMKSLIRAGDDSLSEGERSDAAVRAARKFWEAKVCARGKK
jgi:hypothetical protein